MTGRSVSARLARAGALAGVVALGIGTSGCGADEKASPAVVTVTATATAGSTQAPVAASTPSPSLSTSAARPSESAVVEDVAPAQDVQGVLRDLGFELKATGTWDAATREAVKQFQTQQKLPATGIVDRATRDKLMSVSATHQPSAAATTDAEGYTFDGVYWSANNLYRSKNRQCVVHEQAWQQAVEGNKRSAAVGAHDSAAALGCNPDSWTPRGIAHPRVDEVHTDGEACTKAQLGTVATGGPTWAVCNQPVEGRYQWKELP